MSDNVIVICGPTASGKTALSVEIAKKIGAEIVSADSMQIYKEMNIGTAKPDFNERRGVTHYMMDVISVTENYNVSRYVTEAGLCIDELLSKGKRVIITGGTGLYIDSLINNTNFFEIENDYEYRENLINISKNDQNAYIWNELCTIDPVTANKLHINDTKRIIRALEVFHVTGKRISDIQTESIRQRKYTPVFIGLNYRIRDILYERIEKRVDFMIESGLLDECLDLLSYDLSDTARAAIGYSDIFDCINGKLSLEDAVVLIKKKTRNYAKRQLTWFRKNDEIKWFYADDYSSFEELTDSVYSYISEV